MNVMANIPLQPTVKKLRFLPSAELARSASQERHPLCNRPITNPASE